MFSLVVAWRWHLSMQLKTATPNPNIWLLTVDFWLMTNDFQAMTNCQLTADDPCQHRNSRFGVVMGGTQWMYFTQMPVGPFRLSLPTLNCWFKVKVTLWLMAGQSVCLDVEPFLLLRTDVCYCLMFSVMFLWGALSDERSGLSFVSQHPQYLVACQSAHKYYISDVSDDKVVYIHCI
jgi:hypothetical protein